MTDQVGAPELAYRSAVAPVVRAVRRVPCESYLCSEVADALEVSPATIRRLSRAVPLLAEPPAEMTIGAVRVPIYDAATVDRIREYLAQRPDRGGRPRLWDDSTRRARRAAFSAAGYRRRRAQQLRLHGRFGEADEFDAAAGEILARLRADHASQSATFTSERRG